MKKITLSLMLFLALVSGTYAQVQVGEGTNEQQSVPFEPYYRYSYGQSIYLASEINASGSITAIKWYYSGTSNLDVSQGLVVYLGHTDKASFLNNTDFIDLSELTLVYTGGIAIPTPVVPGWVTITLDTPFDYDGVENLVVAVDESQPGYNSSDDDFYNTPVSANRSISVFSDDFDINPLDPSNDQGSPGRNIAAFVPNIIFEGIQQLCPNPTSLGAENLTTVSADLKWNIDPAYTSFNVEYGEGDLELGSGTVISNVTNPYSLSDLDSQTTYSFYVQTSCDGGVTSSWVGPYKFTTPCDPVTDFFENFDSYPTGEAMPDCWSKISQSTSSYAYVNISSSSPFSGNRNIELYNSGDSNARLFLVSPNVTTMEDKRLKFRATGSDGYTVQVGTIGNPQDPTTFVSLQTINLTSGYAEYIVNLNSVVGNFIAIKHGLGGTYRTIQIDNVLFETVPTEAPGCVNDLNINLNENCGNYASFFEWSMVEGADGYKLSIGTTEGATDVLNEENLGNVTSYSFSGNYNATYYYSLIAFNAIGNAMGCIADSFTTAPDGCYCVSAPGPNMDGIGITNVQLGSSDFAIDEVSYEDHTDVETIDFPQALNANVKITFETGYTYDTHIWIDFNDDYNFDANEKVYTGVSTSQVPTTLNASFLMPEDAALGVHRMRIGTADNGQEVPDPCYNENYGVTLDFLINVTPAPECLPPVQALVNDIVANEAMLNWNSTTSLVNIEYGETGFALGEGTQVNGVAGASQLISSLEASTSYSFYLQSDCGSGSLSPWSGPFTFTTLCDAFGAFTENFNEVETGDLPSCWFSILDDADEYAVVEVYDGYLSFFNEYPDTELYLISPMLADLPSNNYRAKFKAAASMSGYVVEVGTMSDPLDHSTFTLVQTKTLTTSFVEYIVNFDTSTTDGFIAFRYVADNYYTEIGIDDFIWEPQPLIAPDCASDVSVTPNENCGNFASLFEWSAVEGVDGYKLTIGTASGANDVLDAVDLGNVVSVNFSGNYNTTYYYKLVPYNNIGSASGCIEESFITADDGCYCVSVPGPNMDNDGVTNVQLGDTDFAIDFVSYMDNTEIETIDLPRSENANVEITFETGYTYDMHIWIDFNDNYTFEANEKVYTGVSTSQIGVVHDASFMMPADAALGIHRMRIGTADSGQEIPNPCYNGNYGVTMDFLINVVEALSVSQFDSSDLKVYPNPVKDVLNISFTRDISNVEVYNLLGQKMISKSINAHKGQIDMSDLSAGNYLVKVAIDDQVKVMKVIKN